MRLLDLTEFSLGWHIRLEKFEDLKTDRTYFAHFWYPEHNQAVEAFLTVKSYLHLGGWVLISCVDAEKGEETSSIFLLEPNHMIVQAGVENEVYGYLIDDMARLEEHLDEKTE